MSTRTQKREKKKCPDEYTASQEDLLIGGSLSPSVVELRPNPSLRLNETVQIPHDGPRQQLLEWVGRMRSKGKGEGKRPRPPPTVHTPWSHLNQSWNPGWPCLLWSLSLETSTFRIKMISSTGPASSKPTHQVWLRFFFLANSLKTAFSLPVSHSYSTFMSRSELKDREDFLPECISAHLTHAKPRALLDHVLFFCQRAAKGTVLWLQRDYSPPAAAAHPAQREINADRERDRGSRHVFAVPLLSSDTARGHRRRDDGSFNLPSQHNWAACHEPHDLWCRQNVHCFFGCFTKGHCVVLDASISRCAAMLSHLKKARLISSSQCPFICYARIWC